MCPCWIKGLISQKKKNLLTQNFWTACVQQEASFLPFLILSLTFPLRFLHLPNVCHPFSINSRLQWLSTFLPASHSTSLSLSFHTPIDVYGLSIMLIASPSTVFLCFPFTYSFPASVLCFFPPSNISFQVPQEQITAEALAIDSSLVMPRMDLEKKAVRKSIWSFLS